MTCEQCKPWCATTEDQLANRQRNMLVGGAPYPCPKCGRVDWASSREMISATPKVDARWRKWIDTPRWRALIVFQLVTALVCLGLAVIANTKWIVIVDAVFAGLNFGLAYNAWRMAQMSSTFEQMRQAFESMANINRALVEGEVSVLMKRLAADGEDAPIAPNKLN